MDSIINKRRSVKLDLTKITAVKPLKNLSADTDNGFRISQRKFFSAQIAKGFFRLGKLNDDKKALKRSQRLMFCGAKKHILTADKVAHTLYSHKCRDRQCVDCQATRSYVWQMRITDVLKDLESTLGGDYSFIFATFTIKNPKLKNLKAWVKVMNAAAHDMFRLERYKKFIVGGIRTTEITRGFSSDDECHPHFHFLLMVPNAYFEGKGKAGSLFLDRETWGLDWGHYLAKHVALHNEKERAKACVERYEGEMWIAGYEPEILRYDATDYPDGYPIVDIQRAKGEDRKTPITLANAIENGGKIFGYILKYAVKGSAAEESKKNPAKAKKEIFDFDDGAKNSWFFEYDKQIQGLRLITPVGCFRKSLSDLDKPDFDYFTELEKIEKIKEKAGNKYGCDLYAYDADKKDYTAEHGNNRDEAINNALLAKTYNMFRNYLRMFNDVVEFHLEYSEDSYNTFDAKFRQVERMRRLVKAMEKTGYVLKLSDEQYLDTQSGEIFRIPIIFRTIPNNLGTAFKDVRTDKVFRNPALKVKRPIFITSIYTLEPGIDLSCRPFF